MMFLSGPIGAIRLPAATLDGEFSQETRADEVGKLGTGTLGDRHCRVVAWIDAAGRFSDGTKQRQCYRASRFVSDCWTFQHMEKSQLAPRILAALHGVGSADACGVALGGAL